MSRVTVVYRNTRGIKSEKGFLFLIFSLFIPGPPDGVNWEKNNDFQCSYFSTFYIIYSLTI